MLRIEERKKFYFKQLDKLHRLDTHTAHKLLATNNQPHLAGCLQLSLKTCTRQLGDKIFLSSSHTHLLFHTHEEPSNMAEMFSNFKYFTILINFKLLLLYHFSVFLFSNNLNKTYEEAKG